MDVTRFLDSIIHDRHYRDQIARIEEIPAREATYADLDPPLPEPLADVLRAGGIEQLYTHQAAAIQAARAGENVVIVTSTASGKTLCYNAPVIERILADPLAKALYLFPTKALAQDQLKTLERYAGGQGKGREDGRGKGRGKAKATALTTDAPSIISTLRAGTYDGDTPQTRRRSLRDEGNIILTNPDMLHSGILPHHARWAHFLENLAFVVIDEVHAYRGIFGSNVANVIRRLRRICAHYEAKPVFICCSATIGNPKEHAEAVVGEPMTLVDNDGSPRGKKHFCLWNPPFVDELKTARRSANVEARHLMTDLIAEWNVQTITFVRARTTAEILYRYVQEDLGKKSHRLAGAVRAYRGGYLATERREIERRLFSGELMGVTTTNALELGIDIGSLDACIIVGYPGTIASAWQQAGRAGRGSEDSLAILIARESPVDQYLMLHPEYFFGLAHESAVTDPHNPYIVVAHLRCALSELPVSGRDAELFGDYTGGILEILQEAGQARDVNGRWYWTGPSYPAGEVSLRATDENNYLIHDVETNKVIGEIDEWGAFTLLHDEAIYMHDAETYFVEKLDLTQRIAYVKKGLFDYFTMAVDRTNIRITETEDEPAQMKHWRISEAGLGPADVTDLVYMFRKVKFFEYDSIGFGNLKLPPVELNTEAFWISPPREALQRVREYDRRPEDGLFGIANALSGVLPIWVMCDPADIGTTVDSANLATPSVFVFDRYPGGLGFAQKTYELIEEVFTSALELISSCPCEEGCPSCVGSPLPLPTGADLDTRGRIPDKEAAVCLLHDLLQREPYVPKPPKNERRATLGEAARQEELGAEPPLEITHLPTQVEAKIRRQLARFRAAGGGG